MKIRFHGAIDAVTGSCYELEDEQLGVHLLVDCGLVQGEGDDVRRNGRKLPFNAASLTHVLLTHAHADHCGLIPRLYAEGYRGEVWATRETAELAEIVMRDAASHGAPFTHAHVQQVRFREPSRAIFANHCPIAQDVFIRFFRSGHIVGATSLTVLWGPRDRQRSITFSGDLGPNVEDGEILPLLSFRMSPDPSDFVVVESTYGGTVRAPMSSADRLQTLAGHLDEALLQRQGVVIIPSFALERAQDVLCDLSLIFAREPEKYRHVPVILDSSMARSAGVAMASAFQRTYPTKDGTKVRDAWLGRGIFRELGLNWRDPDDRLLALDCVQEMLNLHHEPEVERRGATRHWRRIWRAPLAWEREQLTGPSIVIAGQGMADAGPVQAYLKRLLPEASTTVLFSGYCGARTVGGALLGVRHQDPVERRRNGDAVMLCGEKLPLADVKAHIVLMSGYSAHADQAGLIDWLWSSKPGQQKDFIAKRVFITHGNATPRRALKAAIEAKAQAVGASVVVDLPTRDDWIDLEERGKVSPVQPSGGAGPRGPWLGGCGEASRPWHAEAPRPEAWFQNRRPWLDPELREHAARDEPGRGASAARPEAWFQNDKTNPTPHLSEGAARLDALLQNHKASSEPGLGGFAARLDALLQNNKASSEPGLGGFAARPVRARWEEPLRQTLSVWAERMRSVAEVRSPPPPPQPSPEESVRRALLRVAELFDTLSQRK